MCVCVSACALSRTRVERGAKRCALVCVCVHVLSVTGEAEVEAEVDFNSEVLFIQPPSTLPPWPPLSSPTSRPDHQGGLSATPRRSANPAASLATVTMPYGGGGLRCRECKLVAAQLSVTSGERKKERRKKKEKRGHGPINWQWSGRLIV